jgi:hypothetical protein
MKNTDLRSETSKHGGVHFTTEIFSFVLFFSFGNLSFIFVSFSIFCFLLLFWFGLVSVMLLFLDLVSVTLFRLLRFLVGVCVLAGGDVCDLESGFCDA